MYVLVRYLRERTKYVVKDCDIDKFRPANVDDFDSKKIYDAWWVGDKKTRGGYYPAHILHMTQTEEEMKLWTNRNRAVSRKRGNSEEELRPRKKALLEKRAKAAAKKAAEEAILEDREEELPETAPATEAEATIKSLGAEIKELKRQNIELQKALCSKIFETAPIDDRRLQPLSYDRLLIKPSKALGKEAHTLDTNVGTQNEAGDVHVGHGTYIDLDTWQRLLQAPLDSTFCKQLAVRLWGNEVLAQRSLTGTLSNRALSKGMTRTYPPLSPVKLASMSASFLHFLKVKGCPPEDLQKRHKCLQKYLAQKCADLRR
ncbi:hypothetical protein HPB52_000178 [Rhipicephalus sanguineus]|uniref:BEN domain-containing protein n=1 Tax=Rhipicephalus sanguineus TaxID=34632 RepID=A0A9D4STM2_RHISA|nr:hypothetical protein HPB52_000178 [Rhipicephalus sanguineus]